MASARSRSLSLSLAWLCFALVACNELDPVYTIDMCGPDRPHISIHCKLCQEPPFAPQCPQCQPPEPSDQCLMTMDTSPATSTPDSGGTMSGGAGEGAGPSGPPGNSSAGAGSGAGPATPSGGSGQPSGTAGTNGGGTAGPGQGNPPGQGGQGPSAGSAGTPAEECSCTDPGLHCRQDRVCVECFSETHCPGRHCDIPHFACVNCRMNADCAAPVGVCDTTDYTCVQCVKPYDCSGTLGTCDVTTRQCVDCDGDNLGCTDPKFPACLQQQCVECTNDTQCTHPPLRHCDGDTHSCVQCNQRVGDCSDPAAPLCIEAEHRCVQCLKSEDCGDSDYARCTGDNQCAGCDSDAQCQRFGDTPVCNISTHRCVQCNDSLKDCARTSTACILASHSCGTRPLKSVVQCGECESSDECPTGMDCVPTSFGSTRLDAGFRCLPKRSAAGGNCASVRGLGTRLDATNTEAIATTVCAPGPRTSCTAFLKTSLRQSCASDSQCGDFSTDGACTDAGRCTYPCSTENECPLSLRCENATRCNDLAVNASGM